MRATRKSRKQAEFGDFQTPPGLARAICALLAETGLEPASLVEPTCGRGSFLAAALETFPSLRSVLGLDINAAHVRAARAAAARLSAAAATQVVEGDFFRTDWPKVLRDRSEPLLVLGNPPWITSAELGSLGSSNLPEKSNFQKHSGLDAITGKSNFDISEWMLIRMLESLKGRTGTMAMLCKTTVARKALRHAWENEISLATADIYPIDAAGAFDAEVDACLLVCTPGAASFDCQVHQHLGTGGLAGKIGYRDGSLIADIAAYDRRKHLLGPELYRWRSGVKHDCSAVMELRRNGAMLHNGLGEEVRLEEEYLYPMLKGSEIVKGRTEAPSRLMLVTQRSIGEDTLPIQRRAPRTWRYLETHAKLLNRRASSIYANRPPFSVFGVGEYTFARWKVAIAGLYKRLDFKVVGPVDGKPVVLDDTSYFIACRTRDEARHLARLFNSAIAREFFASFIFWDAKRPITIELLRRLDPIALSRALQVEQITRKHLEAAPAALRADASGPRALFTQETTLTVPRPERRPAT